MIGKNIITINRVGATALICAVATSFTHCYFHTTSANVNTVKQQKEKKERKKKDNIICYPENSFDLMDPLKSVSGTQGFRDYTLRTCLTKPNLLILIHSTKEVGFIFALSEE